MEKYDFEEKNTHWSNPRKVCAYKKNLDFHEYTEFLVYRVLLFFSFFFPRLGLGTRPWVHEFDMNITSDECMPTRPGVARITLIVLVLLSSQSQSHFSSSFLSFGDSISFLPLKFASISNQGRWPRSAWTA